MVKDLPTIRRTYLKGWFMIDLISIVPFKYIPGGEGSASFGSFGLFDS